MLTFTETDGRYYVESSLGAHGRAQFGLPKSAGNVSSLWDHLKNVYPYSPQGLKVEAGMEGPQAVLTWEAPDRAVRRLMVRRKLGDYPRDPSDGVLVLDDLVTPNTRTSVTDCAAENIVRMLSDDREVEAAALALKSTLKSVFTYSNDKTTSANDFIGAYEKRFQVSLDPEDKDPEASLESFILGAQKKDLLSGHQESGSNWWYYRVFVQPAEPELDKQFAGEATQFLQKLTDMADPSPADGQYLGSDGWLRSTFLDVQGYPNITVLVENYSTNPIEVELHTTPEVPSPVPQLNSNADPGDAWARVSGTRVVIPGIDAASAGLGMLNLSNASLKNIVLVSRALNPNNGSVTSWAWPAGVSASVEQLVKVHFIVNKKIYWQSNAYLSRPCLVYKTGRHQDIVWNRGHLPEAYIEGDEDPEGPPKYVLDHQTVSRLAGQERVNLYEGGQPRGPLYRFMKLMTLELDRVHHYLAALIEFNPDISQAPAEVLAHIAAELGWEVDLSRPLVEVRQELLRLAGMYKTKGTLNLVETLTTQQLKVTPRVQEGTGLVMRAANPDLFR